MAVGYRLFGGAARLKKKRGENLEEPDKAGESAEDFMDKRKQITVSNQVKAGNRVQVLTFNPGIHVL